MNRWFLARFSSARKSNTVFKALDGMRRSAVFRGARFDIYTPSLQPERLIILLGQTHTVWKGKIGNRERRQIVNCQARLCSYYAYFEQFLGIKSFGGEGLYDGLEMSFQDRSSFQLYEELMKAQGISQPVPLTALARTAKQILAELGKRWHQELRSQQNLQKIQQLAAAVSGQTLFNALNKGAIRAYPIEGERAYQQVLKGITHLGQRIEKLEQTQEMRFVKQRGGKPKNEKEAQVVLQYNALVKEFNRLIGSDIRERATMEITRQKAAEEGVVVFTMGVAHRKNYLKLVEEYLGAQQTAFAFITPPELLINWWLVIGVPILLLLGLLWFNSWLA